MQRHSLWRSIGLAATLLVAGTWAAGTGWQVSRSWALREALARVELAREEAACSYRMGGPDNEQRCRELARIISHTDLAKTYFTDGVIVVLPVLALLGLAFWLGHSPRPHHPPQRPHDYDRHHRRPSPA